MPSSHRMCMVRLARVGSSCMHSWVLDYVVVVASSEPGCGLVGVLVPGHPLPVACLVTLTLALTSLPECVSGCVGVALDGICPGLEDLTHVDSTCPAWPVQPLGVPVLPSAPRGYRTGMPRRTVPSLP